MEEIPRGICGIVRWEMVDCSSLYGDGEAARV